jgi:hypothetical protein
MIYKNLFQNDNIFSSLLDMTMEIGFLCIFIYYKLSYKIDLLDMINKSTLIRQW